MRQHTSEANGKGILPPKDEKRNLAVIAIGNELMGDDGVGPAVLHALSAESLPGNMDLIDGGTGGMSLLHIIKDYTAVIFIDCVDFGGTPGKVKVFSPEEVHSTKRMQKLSLHEADVLEVIQLSQKIGEAPKTIVIVAIQPKTIAFDAALSNDVAAAVPHGVKEVLSQIERLAL